MTLETEQMSNNVRNLREDLSNPKNILETGQESIVLSELNKKTEESIVNIQGLYKETKALKTALDEVSIRNSPNVRKW